MNTANTAKATVITSLLAGIFTSTIAQAAKTGESDKQILMVLSSYGEKNAEGELVKPGYEFDEMTKSYLVFKSAGAQVTFASPDGGELITDNYDANKPYNQTFLADKDAIKQLANTYKLSQIDTQQYDAVYVVGGKGPMFDLAEDKPLKTVLKQVYENQGIIGAVCHGPAALLNVQLSDGSYLVDGKRVSAFTNLEESTFTKKWTMPFSLADELKAQGANYQQDGLMLNQVSIDGRLITGQNPFSTADTAKALVVALGLELKTPIEFKDDNSIKLAEVFLSDAPEARKRYQANTDNYDTMLLGMLGVYQAKYAQSQIERDAAIAIMETTREAINHPMLDITLANTYAAQNNEVKAREVLKQSLAKHPDNDKLTARLAQLSSRQ